jgi:hypothetical protein
MFRDGPATAPDKIGGMGRDDKGGFRLSHGLLRQVGASEYAGRACLLQQKRP